MSETGRVVIADGKPLPGWVQVALQGGSYAAKSILRKVQGQPDRPLFRYFERGLVALQRDLRAVKLELVSSEAGR